LLNIIYKFKNILNLLITGFLPIFQSKNLEYWVVVESKTKE